VSGRADWSCRTSLATKGVSGARATFFPCTATDNRALRRFLPIPNALRSHVIHPNLARFRILIMLEPLPAVLASASATAHDTRTASSFQNSGDPSTRSGDRPTRKRVRQWFVRKLRAERVGALLANSLERLVRVSRPTAPHARVTPSERHARTQFPRDRFRDGLALAGQVVMGCLPRSTARSHIGGEFMDNASTKPMFVLFFRVFWIILGPFGLLFLLAAIVQSGGGWLTGKDLLFGIILLATILCRWGDSWRGERTDSSGEPVTETDVWRYTVTALAAVGTLWAAANLLATCISYFR
jgi:hypothetical protein